MDKPALTRLLDYHYWANRQLWRPVMALSEAQFTQPVSDTSPSLRTLLVRMVANENLWVNYLWHGDVEFLQEAQLPTRASIRAEWDALEEEIRDFVDELSPAALQRQVQPVFLSAGTSLRVWEILLQIINDATACRAQVRLYLHQLGSPAPAHEFLDFLVDPAGRATPQNASPLLTAYAP